MSQDSKVKFAKNYSKKFGNMLAASFSRIVHCTYFKNFRHVVVGVTGWLLIVFFYS